MACMRSYAQTVYVGVQLLLAMLMVSTRCVAGCAVMSQVSGRHLRSTLDQVVFIH